MILVYMSPIELDGASLTVDQLLAVAQDGAPVALAEAAQAKVARAAEAVETLLARGEIAYGITTGFGAFKDRLIPRDRSAISNAASSSVMRSGWARNPSTQS